MKTSYNDAKIKKETYQWKNKRKCRNITKYTSIALAVVFLSGCASSQNTDDDFHGTPQLAAKETKQNTQKAMFAYDAQQLVYAVEAAHPAFVLDGMLPENYEEAKKNFLKSSKNIKTRDDFEIEICKYLSSLNDSHTYVLRDPTLGTDSTLNRIGSFSLDVEYSIKHDDICLKPEGGGC